jgi:hypothetical protein
MKWCCTGFKSSYETSGQRGSAILIGRNYLDKPEFTLQFRAVDIEENFPVIKAEFPISTVVDVRIHFCPWCGVNLEKWYGTNVNTLHQKGLRIDE